MKRQSDDPTALVIETEDKLLDLSATEFSDWLPTERFVSRGQVVRIPRAAFEAWASQYPSVDVRATLSAVYSHLSANALSRPSAGSMGALISGWLGHSEQSADAYRLDEVESVFRKKAGSPEWAPVLAAFHRIAVRTYGRRWMPPDAPHRQVERLLPVAKEIESAGLEPDVFLAAVRDLFNSSHFREYPPNLSRLVEDLLDARAIDSVRAPIQKLNRAFTLRYKARWQSSALHSEREQIELWEAVLSEARLTEAEIQSGMRATFADPLRFQPPTPEAFCVLARQGEISEESLFATAVMGADLASIGCDPRQIAAAERAVADLMPYARSASLDDKRLRSSFMRIYRGHLNDDLDLAPNDSPGGQMADSEPTLSRDELRDRINGFLNETQPAD